MNTELRNRSETTCIVVDDHPAIIDAVSRYLTFAGFAVVATAGDGQSAVSALEKHHPDVCIADVRMPRMDGIELVKQALKASPRTGVLLYSGAAEPGTASDALDAGARGVALKDAPLDDLTRAVETVAAGGIYLDPVLAAALASARHRKDRKTLSNRERDVLRLLSSGGSYAEIGSSLYLSPDTVRAHAQRAMTKLGARTRTQAVAIAMREALIA
jgi:DNA-binding NarL/FixJ family response regulator